MSIHPINAQSTKPQLVSVSQLLLKSDAEALKIAEKINPEFFVVDEENFDKATFSAHFLPLDIKNPKRFLVLSASNTNYYCTSYGCPYYIYEQHKNNQWSLALSVQALSLFYDKNTQGSSIHNLISQSIEQAKSKISFWLWNGQYFKKLER